MKAKIILMLLPALAYARITVHMKVSTDNNEKLANFSGTDSNIISDIEIEAFNITTSNLKAAVHAHTGGTPLDVFVKSPTPWGDLYKTYNWSELKRETRVKAVKIANIKTETVKLYTQSYSNKLNTSDITLDADVKADVENYVNNNFAGKEMSVDADYNIDLFIGSHLQMPLKLVSHLGVNGSLVKEAMKVQAKEKFTLKPLQAAELILNATKVNMIVFIEYESSVTGQVTANYNPRYQGHHFWAYDVNALIKSFDDITNVQKGTDVVTIEYFTNASGYIIDQNTRNLIAKVHANYFF